jgi:uncharacterized cupredoxin-like copper-binding protein
MRPTGAGVVVLDGLGTAVTSGRRGKEDMKADMRPSVATAVTAILVKHLRILAAEDRVRIWKYRRRKELWSVNMVRKRVKELCAVCFLGLSGWLLVAALAAPAGAAPATVINVIAGKPSELAFKLSKFSALPVGTITFNVKNEGLAFHDFKLCKVAVASDAHNACVGVTTKILKPGQTATLTVKITKKGTYEYLCSEPGHAAAGMKGLIGVGVVVKVKVPPKVTTTVATTTTVMTTAPVTTTTVATTTTSATTTSASASGGGNSGCPPGGDGSAGVTEWRHGCGQPGRRRRCRRLHLATRTSEAGPR